jgi:phage shock protein PspC (stress-responsive transcriptional regulator)
LAAFDPERWFRDHPERRVAGVASAVARALALPVGAVRLGFIVLTFVHLLGPLVYGALWLLIPFTSGGDAPFTRALAWARDTLDRLIGERRRATPRRTDPRPRDDADAGTPAATLPSRRVSS